MVWVCRTARYQFLIQGYNMGFLTIYQDNYTDSTVISNRFIDEYMQAANDAQLKIYPVSYTHLTLPTICSV